MLRSRQFWYRVHRGISRNYRLKFNRIEKFTYQWQYLDDKENWIDIDKSEHEIFIATEEEFYALENNLADKVNYWGLDPKIAKTANETIHNTLNQYPALRKKIKFIGSFSGVERYIKLCRTYDTGKINWTDNELLKALHANKSGCGYASTTNTDIEGIYLNDTPNGNRINFETLTKVVENNMKSNWSPKSDNAVKFIIDHELGHIFDFLLGISSNDVLMQSLCDKIMEGKSGKISDEIGANLSMLWKMGQRS